MQARAQGRLTTWTAQHVVLVDAVTAATLGAAAIIPDLTRTGTSPWWVIPGIACFAGLGWREQREFEVVAVGCEIPGASMAIAFPHAQERVVAAIAETVVAELLAAELWRRHPI